MTNRKTTSMGKTIPKSPNGIRGLDEITGGGLPAGRPTLVCSNDNDHEPGVFFAFEETKVDLVANVGFPNEAIIGDLSNIELVVVGPDFRPSPVNIAGGSGAGR